MDNISKENETNETRVENFPVVKSLTPEVSEEMLSYKFWTSQLKDGKKLIMDLESIKRFNYEIEKKVNKVVNLEEYKETLSKKELTNLIKEYKLPEVTMYDDKGKVISKIFLENVNKNINLEAIKDNNKVSYGMSMKKTSIRSFPTETGFYDSQSSTVFDRLQETGLEPCEAVIILHESLDKKWYFIQMNNYRGWVIAKDIALAKNKSQVFDYINSDNFIIVSGNHISLDNTNDNSVNNIFNMGDKLVIVSQGVLYDKNYKTAYVVKLPIMGKDNLLDFKEALILKNKDVVNGYLPYTRENIIKQAFKLQGDKYDWGNKYDGRDCSSFVTNIFKTFGLILPRNTNEQEESYGKQLKFTAKDTIGSRKKLLDNVESGAIIFMPGHEMIYLGKVNETSYIIHDFTSYGKKQGNKYIYTSVFSVNITTTMLTLSSGVSYLSKFTSVLQIQN